MKYLSSLVIFTFLFLQSGYSQVKKQYVDNKNSTTTVVVKEDNVDDFQILNSQFDINSFGLGEVIMIKTEQPAPETTAEVPQEELAQAEVGIPEVATKKVVKEAIQPARNVAALPKAKVRKRPTENYYKGVGKSSKKKLKRKRKKRFKNKKIKKKRRKRRRVSCPSF